MSQHSSCWLARHQFFIKYCIAEKETFKGEEKIEFAVSTQAVMISAFYKVINWLYKRKKQVVLQMSTNWVLSSVLLLSFLKHLEFSPPWGTARMERRMNWLHDKVCIICAFTSSTLTNTSVGSPHVAKWIRTGHNSVLLQFNTYHAFYLVKGKKG